jgi:hypothetical protein
MLLRLMLQLHLLINQPNLPVSQVLALLLHLDELLDELLYVLWTLLPYQVNQRRHWYVCGYLVITHLASLACSSVSN